MNDTKYLFEIAAGDTFKVGKFEFIVLEQSRAHDKTKVLLKDFWTTTKFDDDTNDYKNSWIREKLNGEFLDELANEIGRNNIVLHTVDLTADDGRKDYSSCNDCVSLLTCDMYRKYVDIIDKYRITSDWGWLATPCSTSSNGYSFTVRCVYRDGTLFNYDCYYVNGVRPFCIFKSDIFVS